jgi:hypothetical protein
VSSFCGQYIFPPIQIQQELIELCGGSIIRVEYVRKWCKEFENGRTSTMMIAQSVQHTKATRKHRMRGELILECWQIIGRSLFPLMKNYKRLCVNCWYCSSLFSTMLVFLKSLQRLDEDIQRLDEDIAHMLQMRYA